MICSGALLYLITVIYIVKDTVHCDKGKYERFAISLNRFSLDLYKELARTETSNFILSPLGVAIVLTILLTAAHEDTASELNTTMYYEGHSMFKLRRLFRSMLGDIKSRKSENNLLSIATSIWLPEESNLEKHFTVSTEDNFYATIKKINFNKGNKAKDIINSWSNNATKGLITTLFNNDLSLVTTAVLANAIYFKGMWKYKFIESETSDQIFYNTRKKPSKKVPMMNQIGQFNYRSFATETVEMSILEMEYQINNISMIILLPHEDAHFHDVEEKLKFSDFHMALQYNALTEVNVTVPRFKDESEFDLITPLKELGINNVFSDENANLTSFGKNVYVSEAFQKTKIEVTEEGNEEAPVPAAQVAYYDGDTPVTFLVNRPFIYVILDRRTGVILLIGRVNDPK